MKKLFTSESVTEGHPDKLCDQISDAILDEILRQDENARVACEVCATTGLVLVMGEITTKANADITAITRATVKNIGYDNPSYGFDGDSCAVITALDKQSPDIAVGVDDSLEHRMSGDRYDLIGAGDQGIMFGYAACETEEFMPLPIMLSHALTERLAYVRKNRILDYLRPDGKAQVTVEYDGNRVKRVDAVVVSAQHNPDVDIETLREGIYREVIIKAIPARYLDTQTKYYINPTGRFVIGGPQGDSGLTGRKIIVDTYGGRAPHGGGSFSGKDPTKVDRSATYYARYAAKNIVAAGLADMCELQIAYAIGKAKPLSIAADTSGTGKLADTEIAKIAERAFDFRPASIIEQLDLRKPIYLATASYGHFGRKGFSWERTDRIDDIKRLS